MMTEDQMQPQQGQKGVVIPSAALTKPVPVPANLKPKPGEVAPPQPPQRIIHNVTDVLEIRIDSPSQAKVIVKDVLSVYRSMENFGLKRICFVVARESQQQVLNVLGNTFRKYPIKLETRDVLFGNHMLYTPSDYEAVMQAPGLRPPKPKVTPATPEPPGKDRIEGKAARAAKQMEGSGDSDEF